MSSKTKIVLIGFLAVLTIAQLYLLKSMHYTTSSISWFEVDEGLKQADPSPDFEIGNLEFDLDAYTKASELQAFREFFSKYCEGRKGIEAASCMSETLVDKVPFGEPSEEVFTPGYDPVANFKAHLK
ncbi:MAG: hypothetical protein HKN33_00635, partial [Pyrinomonadaceae bacterium]|nr:hypothetical protein [Pyrinomonadaceae bacterium]